MRSKRENTILLVTAVAVGLWALDFVVIGPLTASRDALLDRRARLEADLLEAQKTINTSSKAAKQWRYFRAAGLGDASSATGGGLLNTLLEWSRDSSLPMQSLRPDRAGETQGLHELTFQAGADGSLGAMSRFLFRVESSTLPIRPRELQIAARAEGSDDLTMQVRLSTLWEDRPAASAKTAGSAAAGSEKPADAKSPAPAPGSAPASGGAPATQAANKSVTTSAVNWASPPKLLARDAYDVIYRRNIFRRGGGSYDGSSGVASTAPASQPATAPLYTQPSNSASNFVLTGTVVQDKERVAFIENTRDGVTLLVRVGDMTAGGKVLAVNPQGVKVQTREGTREVMVGDGLDGLAAGPMTRPSSAEAGSTPGAGTGGGTGEAAPAVSPGEAALLERMKARRAAELGK